MGRLLRKALFLAAAGAAVAGCVGEEPVIPTFPDCRAPLVTCGESCVDTAQDALHCGSCDVACALEQGEICADGECVRSCGEERADCGDRCADLQTDADHCGDCDTACDTSAGELCSAGACAPRCGSSTEACGSSCVNLQTDPTHCGDCDAACDAGEACVKGKCALTCSGGTTRCGTRCVALDTDPAHCGDCSSSCDVNGGELCSGGKCGLSCGGGTTRCGDQCVDTAVDAAHCGDCKTRCAANATCDDGQCRCPDGYEGDGETCTDIDECAADNDCSPTGQCQNTEGSYVCRCYDGQSGDGKTCTGLTLVTPSVYGYSSGGDIWGVRLSGDGRYVAFVSTDYGLVRPVGPPLASLFLRDTSRRITTRLSVSDNGTPANGTVNGDLAFTPDGGLVSFTSQADNLDPDGAVDDGGWDIFVRDLSLGTTVVRSRTGSAAPPSGDSANSELSADRRFVTFDTTRRLTDTPINGRRTIYRVDLEKNAVELVSVSSSGKQATAPASCDPQVTKNSYVPTISGDGKLIAFQNDGTGLTDDPDDNCLNDVFLRDLRDSSHPKTTLISMAPNGSACTSSANEHGSYDPALSQDGRFLAFASGCIDLDDHEESLGYFDIFLRDLAKGTTKKISLDPAGGEANGDSFIPQLSADGRYLAYMSYATNLVDNDTNGRPDLFLYDRVTGETTRANLDANGNQVPDGIINFALAASGAAVAFTTQATLVTEDTNEYYPDLYERFLR